jgi:hypothetical protein
VQIDIGTTSFGTDGGTVTALTTNFDDQGTNQFGFNVGILTATVSTGLSCPGGTCWLTLSNASVANGDPVFWDENSGPSQAYENSVGSIPSEAFDVVGSGPACIADDPKDSFKIIYSFTGGSNGASPGGIAIDKVGSLYGVAQGGDNGFGLAYSLKGQNWTFNNLYSFTGGYNGQPPISAPIVGPDGSVYGGASGGLQNCPNPGDDNYCGLVYNLKPSPSACRTSLCPWTQNVSYRFQDGTDAFEGVVVGSDQAGNLFGFSPNGGAYGKGAVFELTPSSGGWTEEVIYSFTGSDGDGVNALLVGQDGNLYGTTFTGGHGGGVVFQLVLSGGGWTEQDITSFGGCTYYYGCSPVLVQENSGNLYVLDSHDEYYQYYYDYWDLYGTIYMISPSDGKWQVTLIDDRSNYYNPYYGLQDWGYDLFHDLTIDAAGRIFMAEGTMVCCYAYGGGVFELPAPQHDRALVSFSGDNFGNVKVGAGAKLYGTTSGCGTNGNGTVWQLTPPLQQPKFKVLHDFTGVDGADPQVGLTMDAAGNLYGTTYLGGGSSNCSQGCGTAFKLSKPNAGWLFAPLHIFTGAVDGDGAYPEGRLTLGPDGALYGTTVKGGTVTGQCYRGNAGCGTVFSLKPQAPGFSNPMSSWAETVLYQFQGGNDGVNPLGQIVFDEAGNLYGVTRDGGSADVGTLYELVPSGAGWIESLIYTFSGGGDGSNPAGGLVSDQSGNLYGTTYDGGNLGCDAPLGCGAVFQFVPSGSGWTENRLYAFSGQDGYNPLGDLILDDSGNVYGRTFGSNGGFPIVYMLYQSGHNWNYDKIYGLPGGNGGGLSPQGLTMDAAGNLYGATCTGGLYQQGYIFELQPGQSGWTFAYLHDFQGSDGACPVTEVLIGANGRLYGTTAGGGAYNNGVVWELMR